MTSRAMDYFYFFAGYFRSRPFHNSPELQSFVRETIFKRGIKTFFETGTYRGDTLRWVTKQDIRLRCLSVESKRLYYQLAALRFRNEAVIFGESDKVLPKVLPYLAEPVLFWLDAHCGSVSPYPLKAELDAIKRSTKRCLIIVDDYNDPEIAKDVEKPDTVLGWERDGRAHMVAVMDWMGA